VHKDYIAAETLVVLWSSASSDEGAYIVVVTIEGAKLTIKLRKHI